MRCRSDIPNSLCGCHFTEVAPHGVTIDGFWYCGPACTEPDRPAVVAARLAEAEELLKRLIKYVQEDRAVTPGMTRLARLTDETERWLAEKRS